MQFGDTSALEAQLAAGKPSLTSAANSSLRPLNGRQHSEYIANSSNISSLNDESWEAQAQPLIGVKQSDLNTRMASNRNSNGDNILVDFESFHVAASPQPSEHTENRWSRRQQGLDAEEVMDVDTRHKGGNSVTRKRFGSRMKRASARNRAAADAHRILSDPTALAQATWAEKLWLEHAAHTAKEAALVASDSDKKAPRSSSGNNKSHNPHDYGFGKTQNKSFGIADSAPPPTSGFAPRAGSGERGFAHSGEGISRRGGRHVRVIAEAGHESGSRTDEHGDDTRDAVDAPLLGGGLGRRAVLADGEEDAVCGGCVIS